MKKLIVYILISVEIIFASKIENSFNLCYTDKNFDYSILEQFGANNKILVNYTLYNNDYTMYDDIISGNKNRCDMVIISTNYINKLIAFGSVIKLNKAKIPNIKYLYRDGLYKGYDRNNEYSIPFNWGTNIIVYNQSKIKILSWNDLWQSRLKDKLYVPDDLRGVFGIALKSLLISANTSNSLNIKKGYYKLSHLIENITIFGDNYSGSLLDKFKNNDIYAAVLNNSDAYNLIQNANKHNFKLNYIYPKEGVIYEVKASIILSDSKNINISHSFINFISSLKKTKQLILHRPYPTVNLDVKKYITEDINRSKILYQSKVFLKISEFVVNLGSKYNTYYQNWKTFKKVLEKKLYEK